MTGTYRSGRRGFLDHPPSRGGLAGALAGALASPPPAVLANEVEETVEE